MSARTGTLRVLGARETVLVLAIALFIAHASLLVDWVVDDAGITFAYARNLAHGHGLVSQPGLPPVEGFSNPLWTLVFAALFAMDLFSAEVSPKVLGGGLVVATLVFIWSDLRRHGASALGIAVPLLLIAACTPFVVWTTSGLENPLLAFLVVACALLSIRAGEAPSLPVRTDVAAGLLAGLAAMTRPDAVVYAAIYPAVLLARLRAEGLRSVVRRWSAFAVACAAVYGSYLVFRLGYYGRWLPNTFYAKPEPSLARATRRKLIALVEGASGDLWPLVPVLLCVVAGWLLVTRRLGARTAVLMGYLGASASLFLVLPHDWMGEFRFATVFFPLLYWVLSALAHDAAGAARDSAVLRRAVLAGTAVFVAQAIPIFAARTMMFASDPTVPLDDIAAYGGDGFNRLAEVAGVADASFLTPDVGGALLKSRLRIFDLGGLCDERIARATSSGQLTDLRRYVFEEMRPTFIHTHGQITYALRLFEDPRFERDYVAVYEHLEGPAEWAARWPARVAPPWSGDYIRREAVSLETLNAVRMEYRRLGLQRFLPWLGPEDRRRAGWPQAVWAFETLRRKASVSHPR